VSAEPEVAVRDRAAATRDRQQPPPVNAPSSVLRYGSLRHALALLCPHSRMRRMRRRSGSRGSVHFYFQCTDPPLTLHAHTHTVVMPGHGPGLRYRSPHTRAR
jgi:hypothetical protein